MSGIVQLEVYILDDTHLKREVGMNEVMSKIPELVTLTKDNTYVITRPFRFNGVLFTHCDITVNDSSVDNTLVCLFITPTVREKDVQNFIVDVNNNILNMTRTDNIKRTKLRVLPGVGYYLLFEHIDTPRYVSHLVAVTKDRLVLH